MADVSESYREAAHWHAPGRLEARMFGCLLPCWAHVRGTHDLLLCRA